MSAVLAARRICPRVTRSRKAQPIQQLISVGLTVIPEWLGVRPRIERKIRQTGEYAISKVFMRQPDAVSFASGEPAGEKAPSTFMSTAPVFSRVWRTPTG